MRDADSGMEGGLEMGDDTMDLFFFFGFDGFGLFLLWFLDWVLGSFGFEPFLFSFVVVGLEGGGKEIPFVSAFLYGVGAQTAVFIRCP